MSRTDKDAPFWMRAEFYEPRHGYSCPHPHACDLPAVPVRRHPRTTGRCSCRWWPVWTPYTGPAPGWFVRLVFTGRERRAVREACAAARAEYRGYGEVGTVPPVDQHRHRARREYW